MEGGRHQEVFSFILNQLKETLTAREEILREAIKERVREQGGRLVGWAIGATVASRVLTAVNAELERVSPDSSEMRDAFDEWVRREIGKLETDPERAAELGRAMQGVLAHDTVKAWAWDVWARMRRALEADAVLPHGRSVAVIEAALGNLGEVLGNDEVAQGAGPRRGRAAGAQPVAAGPGGGCRIYRPGDRRLGCRDRSPKSWNCGSARICNISGSTARWSGFVLGAVISLLALALPPHWR